MSEPLALLLDPCSPAVQAFQKVLAGNNALALGISGAQARDLKRRIDRRNSAKEADRAPDWTYAADFRLGKARRA